MLKYLIAGIVTVILGAAAIAAFYFSFQDHFSEAPPSSYFVMDSLEKKEGLYNLKLSLKDLSGDYWDNAKFSNKIVIVSFWATWCQPCVTEFPSLVDLAKRFPDDILLIAISNDTKRDDVINFISAFQGNLPNIKVVMDEKREVTSQFQVGKLPESFVFNKTGKLVKKIVGIQTWNTPDAISFFDYLKTNSN